MSEMEMERDGTNRDGAQQDSRHPCYPPSLWTFGHLSLMQSCNEDSSKIYGEACSVMDLSKVGNLYQSSTTLRPDPVSSGPSLTKKLHCAM